MNVKDQQRGLNSSRSSKLAFKSLRWKKAPDEMPDALVRWSAKAWTLVRQLESIVVVVLPIATAIFFGQAVIRYLIK